MDGLRFWNMAEMRYFLRYINKRIKTPLITEELWEEAKHTTFSTYGDKECVVDSGQNDGGVAGIGKVIRCPSENLPL